MGLKVRLSLLINFLTVTWVTGLNGWAWQMCWWCINCNISNNKSGFLQTSALMSEWEWDRVCALNAPCLSALSLKSRILRTVFSSLSFYSFLHPFVVSFSPLSLTAFWENCLQNGNFHKPLIFLFLKQICINIWITACPISIYKGANAYWSAFQWL